MTRLPKIKADTCVGRDTGRRRGRHITVTPKKTSARHLHFGRIVLAGSDKPVAFKTGERETGFICLKGAATIEVRLKGSDQASYSLSQYDALYVPRDAKVKVQP